MCFLARCQCNFQCDHHQVYNWKTGSVWHSERTCFSIPFCLWLLSIVRHKLAIKKTFIQHRLLYFFLRVQFTLLFHPIITITFSSVSNLDLSKLYSRFISKIVSFRNSQYQSNFKMVFWKLEDLIYGLLSKPQLKVDFPLVQDQRVYFFLIYCSVRGERGITSFLLLYTLFFLVLFLCCKLVHVPVEGKSVHATYTPVGFKVSRV